MYGIFEVKNGVLINELNLRIWDTENNKMIYLDEIEKLNIDLKDLFEYKNYEINKKNKKFIPMLSTNEIDKNKKIIYQGDILKTNNGLLEVRFYNSAFALYNIEKQQHFEYMCNISSMLGRVYEIVGNIFEGMKK